MNRYAGLSLQRRLKPEIIGLKEHEMRFLKVNADHAVGQAALIARKDRGEYLLIRRC